MGNRYQTSQCLLQHLEDAMMRRSYSHGSASVSRPTFSAVGSANFRFNCHIFARQNPRKTVEYRVIDKFYLDLMLFREGIVEYSTVYQRSFIHRSNG